MSDERLKLERQLRELCPLIAGAYLQHIADALSRAGLALAPAADVRTPAEPGPWEKLQRETYAKFRAAAERAEAAEAKLAAIEAEFRKVYEQQITPEQFCNSMLDLLRMVGSHKMDCTDPSRKEQGT